MQLERELVHEAGGERLDRAGLEVRRVQEFGEERDVVFCERGVWEGRRLRPGIGLELGRRGGLMAHHVSTREIFFRDNDWFTHQLLARTRNGRGGLTLILVTVFSRLGGMEPAADAQTLPSVLALADDDLLHRVEAPARLHLEKYELVPSRWDALGGDGLGLQRTVRALPDGVQLERTAPLLLPELVVWQRHVQYVRHASRANNVVVVEQVAALAVGVDGHVLFHAREWTAASHFAQEITEFLRIQRIAELDEVWKKCNLLFCEVRERC